MDLRRRLILLAACLAFGVVALGAYVRLSDAGLGCPDWPGCYGHLVGVPDEGHEQAVAVKAFPGKPVEAAKAWKEMVHRYFAGTLGLLILAICALSWRKAVRAERSPVLPTALLVIVTFQALLGMWTVTLLLKPMVVTSHLLGGMTTLALLVALALGEQRQPAPPLPVGIKPLALLALLAVIAQIALGGWVSSNYAALACPDFPTCHGAWLPPADFANAFTLHRELGQTASGALLSLEALTAIHWSHRVGALVVTGVVGLLSFRLFSTPGWTAWSKGLLGLLALQLGLGTANVLLSLPLPLAVAHNLGAAALLTATLALNLRLAGAPSRARDARAVPLAGFARR
jgi:cytochrome c oxidase assembly protein subunit 15